MASQKKQIALKRSLAREFEKIGGDSEQRPVLLFPVQLNLSPLTPLPAPPLTIGMTTGWPDARPTMEMNIGSNTPPQPSYTYYGITSGSINQPSLSPCSQYNVGCKSLSLLLLFHRLEALHTASTVCSLVVYTL